MKAEEITFEGQEASKITTEKVLEAIESLRNYQFVPEVSNYQISHNCEREKFIKAFDLIETTPEEDPTPIYFGIPIFKKSWIPLNEIWLQGNGQVIKKFAI